MTATRTVFVPTTPKSVYAKNKLRRPTGKQKGLIFKKQETEIVEDDVYQGASDAEVDGAVLADDMQSALGALDGEGYEVVSVTPVVSGRYTYVDENVLGYGYGYGFSYTDGVVIVAKRKA